MWGGDIIVKSGQAKMHLSFKVSFPDQLTPKGGGEWDPTSQAMYPYDHESRSHPSRFVWSGFLSTEGQEKPRVKNPGTMHSKSLISRPPQPQILAKRDPNSRNIVTILRDSLVIIVVNGCWGE